MPNIAFVLLILQLLSPLAAGLVAPLSQSTSPEERAQTLLDSLTPEERVGQLFLLDFMGVNTDAESQIYDLIVNHHIGGVILKSENDNFIGPENTPREALRLIQTLQQNEWLASQEDQIMPDSLDTFRPTYIPLFIGISQTGDGYPYDQIVNGLTQLPSPMAIGATWQPALSKAVGNIMGQELAALGINLLMGPSLDVLEAPNPESAGDLGIRAFGGDPFWVGQMGSAFISGVHEGSQGTLAVAGKHFPGSGGLDRPPEEEIATVRKSLEQLKKIELAPFFAVTGDAPSPEEAVDALLISHIRYQGFQENIRVTTRPVSFDDQAFAEIMSLPALAAWRENGGVMISDDLGSRAVRRFYDPSDLSFDARLVTRDAFLAGNDLLLLGDILDSGDPDTYTTTLNILTFFTQKYREDVAFAQRVDKSAHRILTLKFRLYGTLTQGVVLPSEEALVEVGNSDQITFNVANQAATLISPSSFSELDSVLPEAPGLDHRIVFICDSSTFQLCSECPELSSLDEAAFQQAVERLYGSEASGLVFRRNLISFGFDDLQAMLEPGSSDNAIETSIRRADWVVFAMLGTRMDRPASQALRQLLAERDDLIREKRVIVFALNAPYYLDATDISKITAYYGLYGKTPQFIDIAARILFKELTPSSGALPVSVPGIGYDLFSAALPDPEQTIPVLIDLPETLAGDGTATPEPTPIPEYMIGDQIPIRTGVIIDHNGNPVPDGTPVQFVINLAGEESFSPPVESIQGIARTSYVVNGAGPLEIRAMSELATQSTVLQFDIPSPEEPIAITEIPASPTTNVEPSPTMVIVVPTQTLAPVIEESTPPPPENRTRPDVIDWVFAFLTTLFIGLIAFRVGTTTGQVRWSIRWALFTLIGGLLTYIYISLALPGSTLVLNTAGRIGILSIASAGSGIGWGLGLIWRALQSPEKSRGQM